MLKARYLAPLLASLATVMVVSARPPSGSGAASGGVPSSGGASSANKTCTFKNVGSEGCTVEMHMRPSGDVCALGELEMCVWLVVKCPAGIPAGDPGEECTGKANCEVCATDKGVGAEVTCDGQTFSAETDPTKEWGDVWDDCSAAHINVN